MNKLILYFGFLLIVVNSLVGFVLSYYPLLNCMSSDVVILINTLLIYNLANSQLSSGFKVSLSIIFPVLGFASYVLAVLSPLEIEDNLYFIGFILILFIEIAFLMISKNTSTINQKKS
ncbi:conserved membrane hypothetical protein [Flavobacterium sp. 9R]|nr:conserved membrane hypothetical protein [Flavobacterium sp. 9R]